MNANHFCTRLLLATFFLFGIQSFARAVPYTFTTIDVPGAVFTAPRGINDAGQIVGEFSGPDGHNHGFLDVGGTFNTIDVPGALGNAWGGR